MAKRFAPVTRLSLLLLVMAGIISSPVFAEDPRVVMSTTMGDITIQLDERRAPQTVQNFLAYVDDGFYTNTLFHRVIEGFMIQGGGFTTDYQRKRTRAPVSNEAYNGLRNDRYTISMARTTNPHSATSQFFINSENNRNLNHSGTTQRGWGYAVFGKVVSGREVVDEISTVSTGRGGPFSRDAPIKQVVILSVVREEALATQGGSNAIVTKASTSETAEQN